MRLADLSSPLAEDKTLALKGGAALVNSFAFGGTNGCLVVASPNGSPP
jgi:3-oxoacyl-(acyl-carrier-protein) synthase